MPRTGNKNLSTIKDRTATGFGNKCNGRHVDSRGKKRHEKWSTSLKRLHSEQSKSKRQKVKVKIEPRSEKSSESESELSETSSSSQDLNLSTTMATSNAKFSSKSRERSFANSVVDEQAIRRAKNAAAARKSRQRKVDKINDLEKQVSELTDEINQLKTQVAVSKTKMGCLEEQNLDKDNRIKILEHKLAEAHQTIIDMSRA